MYYKIKYLILNMNNKVLSNIYIYIYHSYSTVLAYKEYF